MHNWLPVPFLVFFLLSSAVLTLFTVNFFAREIWCAVPPQKSTDTFQKRKSKISCHLADLASSAPRYLRDIPQIAVSLAGIWRRKNETLLSLPGVGDMNSSTGIQGSAGRFKYTSKSHRGPLKRKSIVETARHRTGV